MHALVLMAPSGAAPATPELQADHERFIDGLDKDNSVVTGGGFKPATVGFEGAHVVRCASLDEAREIAGSDPLVRANAIHCEVTEWEPIGINVGAVDGEALLHPELG